MKYIFTTAFVMTAAVVTIFSNVQAQFLDEEIQDEPGERAFVDGLSGTGRVPVRSDDRLIMIQTQTGDPAVGAQVHEFTGVPIEIHLEKSLNVETSVKSTPTLTIDQLGSSSPKEKTMLIVHPEGYMVTSIDEINRSPEHSVALERWCSAQGTLEINGVPASSGTVFAIWQSFPQLPELMDLPKAVLHGGPVLATIFSSAQIGKDGTYRFPKLPAGRIQFVVAADDAPSLSEAAWVSNLCWWESILEPDSDLTMADDESSVHSFDAIHVSGNLKPSDELSELRTHVEFEGGRGEIRSRDMQASFRPVIQRGSQPGSKMNSIFGANPLQSHENDGGDYGFDTSLPKVDYPLMLKRAVIWARPGGVRESEPMQASARVDDGGHFTAIVEKSHEYAVALRLQQSNPKDGRLLWTDVCSELARIPAETKEHEIEIEDLEYRSDSRRRTTLDTGLFGNPLADGLGDSAYSASLSGGDDSDFTRMDTPGSGGVHGEALEDFGPEEDGGLPDVAGPGEALNDFGSEGFGEMSAVPGPGEALNDFGSEGFGEMYVGPGPGGLTITNTSMQATSGLDHSIASLVTDLLAAGDRRTRYQLKEPLKELLEKKFDAEQEARETLVRQLTERLDRAAKQVKTRATNRQRIVNEQLLRILSLPEDEFDPIGDRSSRLFERGGIPIEDDLDPATFPADSAN